MLLMQLFGVLCHQYGGLGHGKYVLQSLLTALLKNILQTKNIHSDYVLPHVPPENASLQFC